MKQRVISAIVMLMLVIPIFVIGGSLFKWAVFIVVLAGLKEYLDIKETKKELPILVKLVAYLYLFVYFVLFMVNTGSSLDLIIDFRMVSALLLILLSLIVLYHKRETYSINDANYVFMGVMLLCIIMTLFNNYYSVNKYLLVYLLCITIMTDTFALFTGMLIGRHKLLEVVSPKKTWEGFFGGCFFGTFIPTCLYVTIINSNVNLPLIILVTLSLSIVGQIGDLFFSSVKRYFGKKDFSNLIPEHGGVLDRLDSIIFVLLAFSFFVTVL